MLCLGRQRAYHIDAINMQELAHLMEANLDLAAGDDRPDGRAERYLAGLRLDIAGNTHALEESGEIDTARSGRVANRLGGKQHALECFG